MELEQDEVFMKYYKIYKITKNLGVIKQKMRTEGLYEPKLMDVRLSNSCPSFSCSQSLQTYGQLLCTTDPY